MDAAAHAIYRPRRPKESPLYRLVQEHFEILLQVHEEQFQSRYGRLRQARRRDEVEISVRVVLVPGRDRVRTAPRLATF